MKDLIEELELVAETESEKVLLDIVKAMAEAMEEKEENYEEINGFITDASLKIGELEKKNDADKLDKIVAEIRRQNTNVTELITKMNVPLKTEGIETAIKGLAEPKEDKVLKAISDAIKKLADKKTPDYTEHLATISTNTQRVQWEFEVTQRDNFGSIKKMLATPKK